MLVYIVALGAGLAAARLAPARKARPFPRLTLAVAAAVLAMFAVQISVPGLLTLLARDPALLQRAQLWRAVSALFVQDGGWPGTLSNVACLIVLGAAAERRWSAARWLCVYFGGGIATEFAALAWQPYGAGNSIACFALAGALTMHRAGRGRAPVETAVRVIGLCAGAVLLAAKDIHGVGYAIGAVLGVVFTLRDRRAAAAESSDGAAAEPS